MLKLRQSFVYLVVFCLAATVSWGQDRTFLLPSGGSNIITALDAADLAFAGSVSASVSTYNYPRFVCRPR